MKTRILSLVAILLGGVLSIQAGGFSLSFGGVGNKVAGSGTIGVANGKVYGGGSFAGYNNGQAIGGSFAAGPHYYAGGVTAAGQNGVVNANFAGGNVYPAYRPGYPAVPPAYRPGYGYPGYRPVVPPAYRPGYGYPGYHPNYGYGNGYYGNGNRYALAVGFGNAYASPSYYQPSQPVYSQPAYQTAPTYQGTPQPQAADLISQANEASSQVFGGGSSVRMTRMMNDTIDHTSQQMQHQTQMHNQLQAWTQQTAMQGANLDNQPQRIANACSSIQSVQAMFRH